MSLNRIANIVIDLQEPALLLAGFGVPLVAGILTAPQDASWDATFGASVDVIEVTEDTYQTTLTGLGVTASEDLRVLLDDMFAQNRKPELVLIGRRAAAVAQVINVSIDGTTDGTFTVTINGNDATFVASSNTATEIRDGLVVAINGLGEPVTAAPGAGDTLDVTGDDPGVPFTLTTSHDTATGQISSTVTTPAVRNTLVCVPFVVTAK